MALAYGNEAIFAHQKNQSIHYVVPPATLLIENPAAATATTNLYIIRRYPTCDPSLAQLRGGSAHCRRLRRTSGSRVPALGRQQCQGPSTKMGSHKSALYAGTWPQFADPTCACHRG